MLSTDKPTPPQGPVDIMESAVTSVEFKWKPPKDNGGCPIANYIIERQQVGRNKWTSLGEIPGNSPSFKDSDVDPGRRYCYRIRAKTEEGISDYLQTEDIPAGVLRKFSVNAFFFITFSLFSLEGSITRHVFLVSRWKHFVYCSKTLTSR